MVVYMQTERFVPKATYPRVSLDIKGFVSQKGTEPERTGNLMMKHIRRIACAALAASMLLLLPACEGGGKTVKVTVCEVTHSIFYAPQYAALNLGYFADEGLDIELSNGEGADKVMAAVLSNNIDIGFAGPEASIYVYNEGKEDFTQVFAQMTRRDGSFLVGREPDPDFSWEKLRGKTILPGRKGGVPYMALEYVIRKNGLDPAFDVTLDNSIQFALMAGAFTGGTGDYVTLFEPTASALEKEGKGYIVASVGEEAGEIPYTAYFASQSYMTAHPEVIQGFANAIARAQQWIVDHTDREVAEAIIDQFPDTDLDTLEAVTARHRQIDAWNAGPMMARSALERLETVMTEAGELEKDQWVDFDKLVDNSFAQKAMEAQ